MMPYIRQPKWATVSEKIALSMAYAMLLVVGIMALVHPLTSAGFWFGLVLTLCSASATFGILSGRYRWEWVVLPVLIASQIISAIVLASLIGPFSVIYILVVASFLGRRLVHLTAVARYLRRTT